MWIFHIGELILLFFGADINRHSDWAFYVFFFDEPETILKRKKQSYSALLDSSKMMEEKQARQFPKSKGPKKLQERDHFAKVWATVLHCLDTHFTKTLSNTDKDNLNSEHKDQNLQRGGGGPRPNHWEGSLSIGNPIPQ